MMSLWGSQFTIGAAGSNNTFAKVNIAVLRDGWIVATWLDDQTSTVKAQIFNVDGTTYGTAFNVSAEGERSLFPNIAALPNGQFIIAYDVDLDSGNQLIAKTFDVFAGQIGNGSVIHVDPDGAYHETTINTFADGSYIFTYNDRYYDILNNGYLHVLQTAKSATGTWTTREVIDDDEAITRGVSVTFNNAAQDYVSVYERPDGTNSSRIYLDFRKSNGDRIALKETGGDRGVDYDLVALDDGRIAYVRTANGSSIGYADAYIYDRNGTSLGGQITLLSRPNEDLSDVTAERIEGGFVVAASSKSTNNIYISVYKDGAVEQQTITTSGLPDELNFSALYDGRLVLQWVEMSGNRQIKAQIFDPRAPVVWSGPDIGKQYGGTDSQDNLVGGGGNDSLFGGGDSDVLKGADGADILRGGNGNDVLEGGAGADVLDGGIGFADIAQYFGDAVNIDLRDNTASGGMAAGDSFSGIEGLKGTLNNDTLAGDDNDNVLYGAYEINGAAGDHDRLMGRGGKDTLVGYAGNDILDGGIGGDVLDGGDGRDTADYTFSSAGVVINLSNGIASRGDAEGDRLTSIENLVGSNHGDNLTGGAGENHLYGGHGDDVLSGGREDSLWGGTGNDRLVNGHVIFEGSLGRNIDLARGLATNAQETDTLVNVVYVTGGDGNDTITGAGDIINSVNDTLEGGGGSDHFIASYGNDVIDGGVGSGEVTYALLNYGYGINLNLKAGTVSKYNSQQDTLVNIQHAWGTRSDDVFTGSDLANILFGIDGHDTIDGGKGNDILYGGKGDDVLIGGEDVDELRGEQGNDSITGGAEDVLYGGEGNDTLDGGHVVFEGTGRTIDLKTHLATVINAQGTPVETDVLGNAVWRITAGDERDTIIGGLGNDSVASGGGFDLFYGSTGTDTLDGGSGYAAIDYGGLGGPITFDLRPGAGTVSKFADGSPPEFDTISRIADAYGTGFNDKFYGDTLAGGNVFDGRAGADTIYGFDGTDKLYGGSDNDSLEGGGDSDTLDGGAGADIMIGGAGDDVYYIDNLNDFVLEDSTAGSGSSDTAYVSVRFFDSRKLANIEYVILVGEGSIDNPPPAPTGSADVNEGTQPGIAVLTLPKTDPEGQVLTYTFASNSPTSPGDSWFRIEGNVIYVNAGAQIDVNADTLKTYQVFASDETHPAVSGDISLNIRVAPANNAPPPVPNQSVEVLETRLDDYTVIQLPPKDTDQDTILYSFEGEGATSGDGLFKIVNNEIQVVSGAALDVDQDTVKIYRVVADDQHGNVRTGTVAITIKNVNRLPVIDGITASSHGSVGAGDDAGKIVVLETAGTGEIATVAAHDPDPTNVLSYSLLDTHNGLFSIDAQGKITVANADLLQTNLPWMDYTLTVKVADNQSGEATQPVTIRVKNVNQAPLKPTFDDPGNPTSVTIQENLTGSYKLLAVDADSTDLTFAFDTTRSDGGNAGGLFGIETVNGVSYLKILQPLSYEAAYREDQGRAFYTVYVKTSDGTLSSQPQAMTIYVTDVNEAPSDITFGNAHTLRARTTTIGDEVVLASLVDPDLEFSLFRNNAYAFKVNGALALNDGKFKIDSTTGQVTTTADIADADVGTKVLTIVAYDIGNHALYREETHTVTIVAADAPPVVEFDPGSVTVVHDEGTDIGTTAYTFTIRHEMNLGASTVHWALNHGTTDAADFDGPTSGDITFADNQGSIDVTVYVKKDAVIEPAEHFSLTLTSLSHAIIGTNDTANATILNDDAAIDVPPPGSTNAPPSGIALSGPASVAEYALSGTLVGTLSATDDGVGGNALSYQLLDTAGGRFKLVNGNQIVVDNGFLFDYEQRAAHTILVKVTDALGESRTQAINIGVLDVNPEVTAGSASNDVFYGGVLNDALSGNLGHDRLFGGGGRDTVRGEAGHDTLSGGAGLDKLYGGKGSASRDAFVFDTKLTTRSAASKAKDIIYDFGARYDSILLDDAAFTNATIAKYLKGKGAGLDKPYQMKSSFVRIGDEALDRDDFLIAKKVNASSYKLYWDVDGSGAKAMLEIGTVKLQRGEGTALTYKDFLFI